MKTSIIVPFQRGETYLRDCLDSLKEQAGCDMEILLICDHADSAELECLSDYEELSVQVYHLSNSTGVAAARNLGLDKATGDYVYFLDSDDYLYGNTIEKLVLAAQERDDDIIYGKKKSTWYSRGVFLLRDEDQETGDEEEEDEVSESDSAEQQAESSVDRKNSKKRSNDEEDEDNSEDNTEDSSEASAEDQDTAENPTEDGKRTETDIKKAYRILVAKRKGVRSISVLGILYKRSFIEEHRLRFPENLIYMSDVPFLMEALSKTEKFYKCLSAKYIKRKHNDAINFPSLSQIKDPNRFQEFIKTYYETTKIIPKDSELKDLLDKKYINYYTKVYAPKLKRSKNPAWRKENFHMMSEVIGQANPEVLKALKGYKKKIIRALLQKNVVKSQRIVTRNLARKKMKRILRNKRAFYKMLYLKVF